MPVLKKCYYEVLGIERNATDEDIKKSFRKLALQLHPDKNLDRNEEAKVEFQVLQQAYEVLSNPQERAWYDEHRHAILRGGLNEDFADDSIDIMAFCSSSCYKGFGDDDEGFYTVYRKLFEKITAEEIEAGLEDSDEEIPSFGDALASYEEDVGPFYAFWESFCTRKNFAWYDEYDTRHAGCRRVSRMMDKENKKLRSEAKKDWNQRVRALVDFVKRKDKRVQAWKAEQEKRMKEKEAILAKKFAEEKAKRQQERKKILEEVKKGNGSVSGGHPSREQLKEMEDWMADEFGEANDVESDEEDDCYYCEVCNKSFRTDKAFMNHEKSKKHLRQIQILRETMEEDDENFEENEDEDEAGSENGVVTEDEEEVKNNKDFVDLHIQDGDAHQSAEGISLHDKDSPLLPQRSRTESHHSEDPDDDEDAVLLKNFIKIKLKVADYVDEEEGAENEGDSKEVSRREESPSTKSTASGGGEQTKKKRRRAVKEKTRPEESEINGRKIRQDPINPSTPPTCVGCRKSFENKNQLFRHLKQFSDHAAPKTFNGHHPPLDSDSFPGTSSKAKKGKNRR